MTELFVLVAVGAFAKLIDGAPGLAYAVKSAGLLMSLCLPPAAASERSQARRLHLQRIRHQPMVRHKRTATTVSDTGDPGVARARLGVLVAINVPALLMMAVLARHLPGMGFFCYFTQSPHQANSAMCHAAP